MAVLPMGKWLLPTVRQRFVCDRFPQGEIALGKFLWIHKRTNELPMTVAKVSSICNYEMLRTT